MTFDHREPGTPEAAWAGLLDRVPPLPPPDRDGHLVVLAAHPDDETLGAGGLIATAAASGAAITVVVASDGEASHPSSLTHRRDELAALRRREVYAAVSALAPQARLELLGLPDGHLSEHQDELAGALESIQPPPTHLVTPWSGDRHPDHAACAVAGAQVAAHLEAWHWQYPIWAWHWARPDDPALPADRLGGVRLDEPGIKAKAAALDCHTSQHRPLSDAEGDEPILNAGMLAHFRRDVEVFVVAGQVSRAYFDRLYAQDSDPWRLRERFYEQRKRATVLAALTRPRFRRAFEPGCATGLLTAELARRCDELEAWDIARAAVEQATERLRDQPHVTVRVGGIPDEWPSGRFDLILLSEVGYYCADLGALAARIDESLDEDGLLLACHWRHAAPLHPHSTGAVHAVLGADRHLVVSHVEDDFLLQAWTRRGTSVAVEEGIVR